ncbi:MAG: DNA translocase FtsK [Candidatus Babeliaceae bacterium]|nr:DNA translocase FtsK [Candidatus Babeliaceae bacterium]
MTQLLYQIFGGSFWLVSASVVCFFVHIFIKKYDFISPAWGFVCLALGYSLFMHGGSYDIYPLYSGGLLGEGLYDVLAYIMPPVLIGAVCWILLTVGTLLILGYQWITYTSSLFRSRQHIVHELHMYQAAHEIEPAPKQQSPDSEIEDLVVKTKPKRAQVEIEENSIPYPFPELEKQTSDQQQNDKNAQHAQVKAHVLEEKLLRFSIKGTVTSITVGPLVTLYEYQPHIETKISKIIAREDDLALALQAVSLRIIAPIPGKSVVGFEVAHSERTAVYFSSLYEASLKKFKGYLPLLLGQNTVGATVVVDLLYMPHLLVAGSTGSGKSVALNTMLISLMCHSKPEELKLILIDPKKLEFSVYADLPHLLFPIVTEPERSVAVLRWAIKTMSERYERMAKVGVRQAKEYHALYHDMPPIVIVIDEFADLMITTGKEVEELIVRLAQMARAAGIHIILATQRPSVDVITGLIKVNFPARIAFKVTSKIDSRTIIDTMGADKLLGKGDMLFLDNQGALTRIHGAYISDAEIASVVQQVKKYGEPIYETIIETASEKEGDLDEADKQIFEEIVHYVRQCDEISISLLQRKFRIGYNRSARMMDTLESHGIILPSDGGKMRKVLH